MLGLSYASRLSPRLESELANLFTPSPSRVGHPGDPYNQVHTANGAGMRINQIGQSFVRTPNRDLLLKNVLYVPEASKNLASVHRLTADNNAFMEFHPDYFLIKDQVTRKTLFRGRCEGGLYPLKSSRSSVSNKASYGATKISINIWHGRLGHPSSSIVHQVS